MVADRADAATSDGASGSEVLGCADDGRGHRLPVPDWPRMAGSAAGVRAVADGVDVASADGVRRDVGSGSGDDHGSSRRGGPD